jgi:hypothetical protein
MALVVGCQGVEKLLNVVANPDGKRVPEIVRAWPPLECCFGTSPIQAEKLRPDRWADARTIIQPLARLNGSVPRRDHPIELQNLLLDLAQLRLRAPRGMPSLFLRWPLLWSLPLR